MSVLHLFVSFISSSFDRQHQFPLEEKKLNEREKKNNLNDEESERTMQEIRRAIKRKLE